MEKRRLENFYNKGFGWVCKNCESKLETSDKEKSRLMNEGESESKEPVFSNKAMAKWMDFEQKTLICPYCKIIEKI
jgi:hypothetical protein